MTLQLERIQCGKECKSCPHGPYWYAYWKEPTPGIAGRSTLLKAYVGKKDDPKRVKAAVKTRRQRHHRRRR